MIAFEAILFFRFYFHLSHYFFSVEFSQYFVRISWSFKNNSTLVLQIFLKCLLVEDSIFFVLTLPSFIRQIIMASGGDSGSSKDIPRGLVNRTGTPLGRGSRYVLCDYSLSLLMFMIIFCLCLFQILRM